jgi:hypothetical protein
MTTNCIKGKEWNPFPWWNGVAVCGCEKCERERMITSSQELKIPLLANDICRCHDLGCSQNDSCLRFLNKDNGGERTPHVKSFSDLKGPCQYYMDLENE